MATQRCATASRHAWPTGLDASLAKLSEILARLSQNNMNNESTKSSSTAEQRTQEVQYEFPYHYIPSYQPHFSVQRGFVWGINYVSTIQFLLKELDSFKFTTVADIGCGDGRFTREVALKFPGRAITGIDYSPHAISLAAALNPGIPNLSFIEANVAHTQPVRDVDVAILMEVLEHIPPADSQKFLEGVSSTIRPNGALLLTVPSVNVPVTPKHFRHFSSAMLKEELEPFFSIKSIVPFEQISIRRKLIRIILANKFFSLTNKTACDAIYRYYRHSLFHASNESTCQRLYVTATRR